MSERQLGFAPWSGGPVLKRASLCFGVILASMALFSVMVSSASAKEQRGFFLAGEKSEEKAKQPRFEGESYPTYLNGNQDTTHEWGFQIGTLKCPEAEFFGTLSGATAEQLLSPVYYYPGCSFGAGGWALTIQANGCEDVVNVLNSGPPYVGQFGIKCPAGKSYELTVHGSVTCTFVIPPQTGLTGVSFKNVGEGKKRSVQVTFNVTKLKYSIKGSSPLFCKGEYENGTYTGTATLDGYNEPY